jgi:ABC-type antimicrobial peptide transport system permease subunit
VIAQFSYLVAGYDYTRTNGIKIIAGRDLSPLLASDSNAAVINQTAAKFLGFKDPINQNIRSLGYNRTLTIIGIMEDVVRASPSDPVNPLYMCLPSKGEDRDNVLNLRLRKNLTLADAKARISPIFKKFDPASSLDFFDLVRDRYYGDKFKSIQLMSNLVGLFTTLAVFLTGLGVLGLAAYTAEQRTKELAIRKVLGAAAIQLIELISRYFIRIAVLAMLFTAPISWWAMDQVLDNYPYRASLSWWTAPVSAAIILVVTLIIVGLRVSRVAFANPVKGLGRES